MSVLCTYKISDIPSSDDMLTKIIETHHYVILENPLMIYKSTKLDHYVMPMSPWELRF